MNPIGECTHKSTARARTYIFSQKDSQRPCVAWNGNDWPVFHFQFNANEQTVHETNESMSFSSLRRLLWCWMGVMLLLLFHNNVRNAILFQDVILLPKTTTRSQQQCLITSRNPNDIIVLANTALQHGIGNCGGAFHRNTPNRTSLHETVRRYYHFNNITSFTDTDSPWFYAMTLRLQAYNYEGRARTTGGDEFVGTVTGWKGMMAVVVQTARVWTDHGNGTYTATYYLPRIQFTAYRVTLLHYSTCYDGFAQYGKTGTYRLERGPVVLFEVESSHAPTGDDSSIVLWEDTHALLRALWDERPVCETSQDGVDQLMDGIWMESNVHAELTLQATWTPFCCRPPSPTTYNSILRIGSSTMPYPTLQVGDVYDMKRLSFHNKWIHFLLHRAPTYSANDTLIFSAGLHQLFNGYNPAACVELITRMLCQLTHQFPGRVLVVGPVPIQQHLYDRVDMTDLNVMWINAWLRDVNGQLDRICVGRTDLAEFHSVARMGSIFKGPEAQKVLERLQAKVSFEIMTPDEMELTRIMASASNNSSVYAHRTVWFASIESFLRPRPETYLDHDKIHDKRITNGTSLFHGAHATLMDQLGTLRSLVGP